MCPGVKPPTLLHWVPGNSQQLQDLLVPSFNKEQGISPLNKDHSLKNKDSEFSNLISLYLLVSPGSWTIYWSIAQSVNSNIKKSNISVNIFSIPHEISPFVNMAKAWNVIFMQLSSEEFLNSNFTTKYFGETHLPISEMNIFPKTVDNTWRPFPLGFNINLKVNLREHLRHLVSK